jgi:hypothetical protein
MPALNVPVSNGLGLIILLIGSALFVFFTFLIRQGLKPDLRPLSGYDTLSTQIGQAVESGGRVHISLGSNSITGEDTGVTLAGLAMLDVISEASSISDLSPVASTGDAASMFVISDTIRRAYGRRETLDKYETTSTRLVGLDPVALAGGATSIIADDDVRANVVMGSFGPEVALMTEAGRRQHIPQIVGSDRPETQAVAYAMAEHTLIGEEMFATRAYVLREAPALGSLLAQDVLRWLVIGAIVVGVILKTLGLLG